MIEIKEIPLYDIKQVAEIHKDAFKGFFLTSLGDNFLKLYYTSVKKHSDGLLYGYYIGDNLKGFFCSYITFKRISQKYLKK